MGNIFVSYSFKPWGIREKNIGHVLKVIKKAIENNGWAVVDPMIDIDAYSEGIKDKVEVALQSSDALIAEGTLLIPNVMYECGYMRAHRKPLLYLIDKSVHNDSNYNQYLELIGISNYNKTASDFGDIEYFEYCGDKLGDGAYCDELIQELTKIVKLKFQPHLSIGRVMLNKSFAKLNDKLGRVIELNQLQEEKLSEQPFFAFLSGWVNQLSAELLENDNTFKLDIDYYEKCLREFTESSRKDIYAIADLTDMAEPFWFLNPETKHTKVAERIFLLDVEWCFNPSEISRCFKLILNQARDYKVNVGLKNHTTFLPSHNYFGNATHGLNCIIVKPNIVGRYVQLRDRKVNKERVMLQFVVDSHEANLHLNDYSSIKERTIEFDSNQWTDYSKMVDALFKRYEIGKWKAQWNVPAEQRDDTYFDWYEGHIRAWIKDYNDLINVCTNCIFMIKSRAPKYAKYNNSFKVLEIGFGSGTLSKRLIDDGQVDYYGIDPALKRWESMLQIKFGKKWDYVKSRFLLGRAWDAIPVEIVTKAPFDLICGSLVLHDFYEDEEQARNAFYNMLKYIEHNNLLSEQGAIVFADVFLGKGTPNKEAQILSWKTYMEKIGKLSPSEYDTFKDSNKEMFDNLSEKEIEEIAFKFNYSVNFSVRPERFTSPLKVLILEKKPRSNQ